MDRVEKRRVVITGGGLAWLWATRSLVNKDSKTISHQQDQITMHQRMKDMDTREEAETKLTNYSRVGIDDFYRPAGPIQETEDEATTKGSSCFRMRGDT